MRWNLFSGMVERLTDMPVEPHYLPVYERLVEAYHALRALYVKPRKGRKVREREGHDPTLTKFVEQRPQFRRIYYGIDEGHYVGEGPTKKWVTVRRWKGVAPEVRAVMEAYGRIRDKWHYHTALGHLQRARADRRYMRTDKGKAVKAAYLASDAGKAVVKRGLKDAARKRQIARGEAQQRLFDGWAVDDAIEEVLAHV